jgi:predicted peptidase
MLVRGLILGAVLLMHAQLAAEESGTGAYESRTVTVTERGEPIEFRYRLLRPATIEPETRYPVVLFLHGAGERGVDNERQLNHFPTWMAEAPLRNGYPCFLVAPQCREEHAWSAFDWQTKKAVALPAAPTTDGAAAIAALEAVLAAEAAADPDRVYLTGLSMGGYGSWELAARMPERFAAVLPICGGGDEASATRIAALPTWCFHGEADPVVPVGLSRSMIAALKAAGGTPIYSEFEGVGHDSWTPAYRNPAVLDWLFAQRRP